MVQGTTSDAGKSTLVIALCRSLKRRGISVAPFKPQNMALNSAVTIDGGEIGRAQALQAVACNLDALVDMNPVLLKPETDTGAQVIIHGKSQGKMSASVYHAYKPIAMTAVIESHQRLSERFAVVIVEGAGSPAEINLRENDIANMGFAEKVDCPVILIADIDKGGVFAHIVGTLALLSESEKSRIRGFVINRFRGDIALLQPGLDWLESYTGKPVMGVLPFLQDFHLDAEDSVGLGRGSKIKGAKFKVVIPILPRISNHTDFDPLVVNSNIDVCFVTKGQAIPSADLIILPGSKSVCADLNYLVEQGWTQVINNHLRYGGKVLGICGGYQMLGDTIDDPLCIESTLGLRVGFGLLRCETVLKEQKQLKNREGYLSFSESYVSGYEIHAGESFGADLKRPVVTTSDGFDGAISEDDQVMGTYWHGIFEQAGALTAILAWAGMVIDVPQDFNVIRERQINRLADALEENVDLPNILKMMGVDA